MMNSYKLSLLLAKRYITRSKARCFASECSSCHLQLQQGKRSHLHQNIVIHYSGVHSMSNNMSSFILAPSCGSNHTSVSRFSTSSKRFGDSISHTPKDLIFPEFPTIQAAESVIQGIHDLSGLPWWSAIIVSAFVLRILLPLPLSVYSMHNAVRLQRLQPEIKDVAQQLKKEVSMAMHQFGWDQKKAKTEYVKNLKRHLRNLYIRDNCHPMKDTASFWIRIPLWVSASYALRNMSVRATNSQLESHADCQSMSTEGIAWFTDLTTVDSTLILPVMMGMVTLLNIEIGRKGVTQTTTYRKGLTFALRGLALAFIPISSYLPSGLVLYWVSSGLFSAVQTVSIDRSKSFQRLVGIKLEDEAKNSKESSKPDYAKDNNE